MTMPVRPAAVAGMFYPGDRFALQEEIDAMLAAAGGPAADEPLPKALVVPHAGYVYSGPVAAAAYARLAPWRDRIRRVVMFGPAHRVAVRGLALPQCAAFSTPLGAVPIDAEAAALARQLPGVVESEHAHALEHCLEVQLPFLQSVLKEFRLVPFAVGFAEGEDVARVIEALWGGPETLIVISSDLSTTIPIARHSSSTGRPRNRCLRSSPGWTTNGPAAPPRSTVYCCARAATA